MVIAWVWSTEFWMDTDQGSPASSKPVTIPRSKFTVIMTLMPKQTRAIARVLMIRVWTEHPSLGSTAYSKWMTKSVIPIV
jgi:hypothetical protein